MSVLKFPVGSLAALLIAVAACEKSPPAPSASTGEHAPSEEPAVRPRVAYVTNGVASFWVIAQAGAKNAGRDFDAEVEVIMPNGITEQKNRIEDLLARGVDGIAVSPIDPDNQTDLLNLVAERTVLVTHDSDAPASNRICYIGMDNYEAGRLAGQLVKEALPEGGEVFIFVGRLEQDNAKRRRQGCIDEILGREPDPTRYDPPSTGPVTGNGYTILGTLTDQFDRAKAKANAEDVITRFPEVDCMVGLFAYNPPACLQALKQSGKLGQIKVVAFDEDDETLQGIEDGVVYGTVVQNPYMYGYQSVKLLAELARGLKSSIPPDGFMNIPARKIKTDNLAAFRAELRENLGG